MSLFPTILKGIQNTLQNTKTLLELIVDYNSVVKSHLAINVGIADHACIVSSIFDGIIWNQEEEVIQVM